MLSAIPEATFVNRLNSSLFDDRLHYLQAERIVPRTSFETSDFLVRQHRQLGSQGQYTAHFLALFGDEDVPSNMTKHPKAVSSSLRSQVEAWIGETCPGTRIELTPNLDIDLISLRYSFDIGSYLSNAYRATNVGFGITYTLPILVAALSAPPGSLLLIENPEAHLHPRGQAQMGRLMSYAASTGVQVVVETHSDHVLNGIPLLFMQAR